MPTGLTTRCAIKGRSAELQANIASSSIIYWTLSRNKPMRRKRVLHGNKQKRQRSKEMSVRVFVLYPTLIKPDNPFLYNRNHHLCKSLGLLAREHHFDQCFKGSLSFLATFFALNITAFPKDPQNGENAWLLRDVSGYIGEYSTARSPFLCWIYSPGLTVGISAAMSIPFIVMAFKINWLIATWDQHQPDWQSLWPHKQQQEPQPRHPKDHNKGLEYESDDSSSVNSIISATSRPSLRRTTDEDRHGGPPGTKRFRIPQFPFRARRRPNRTRSEENV